MVQRSTKAFSGGTAPANNDSPRGPAARIRRQPSWAGDVWYVGPLKGAAVSQDSLRELRLHAPGCMSRPSIEATNASHRP